MFQTIKNAWKIPELRKKLIFTLFMLLIFRVGSVIPVPYINRTMLEFYLATPEMSGTILGLYNVMSGGAFANATAFALGIQPYINASIIIQLLTIAIPALERLAKEGGEEGKKTINKITRIATVALGLLMGLAYFMMLKNQGLVMNGFAQGLVIVLAFTAGSAMVMWMGEQITEHGIGNGISMILFANIISGIPQMVVLLFQMTFNTATWWQGLIAIVGIAALIVFIIFVNDAERRIPIQYAKRVVGRKIYGGQNTNLPIKVSMSGVMPVIFAQSICSLPATICAFIGKTAENSWWYRNVWAPNCVPYAVGYFLMIFFFSWFYSTIQYDPVEIANNLKKNGGFIPGFRPGKPTADFIQNVINKIIIFGAVYLAIVAGLPIVAGNVMSGVQNLAIGGTSVIIVVGVALETVKALEAQMLMRHYKGFLD